MTRRPAPFRQADVARVLRAAKQAGVAAAEVRIDPDGTLRLILGAPAPAADAPDARGNTWSDVLR